MVDKTFRSLAAAGGLFVGVAALAGCGSPGVGRAAAAAGSATNRSAVTSATSAPSSSTTAEPSTTDPGTTMPTSTVPAPTAGAGSGSAGPLLIVRSFDGTVGYSGREPAIIGFSRDATNIVSHLTWSSWGAAGAAGRGSMSVDSCDPNCATGTVTQVPATVELSSVVDGHFTAMTETAGSLSRSYSYPSNWAYSAS